METDSVVSAAEESCLIPETVEIVQEYWTGALTKCGPRLTIALWGESGGRMWREWGEDRERRGLKRFREHVEGKRGEGEWERNRKSRRVRMEKKRQRKKGGAK